MSGMPIRFLISRQDAGVLGLGHGDADQLAAGLFERVNLRDRRLDVEGVGRGHRLHPDRVVAADDPSPTRTSRVLCRGLPVCGSIWRRADRSRGWVMAVAGLGSGADADILRGTNRVRADATTFGRTGWPLASPLPPNDKWAGDARPHAASWQPC